jgi:tetratricopeptide (TPR) repeat protein
MALSQGLDNGARRRMVATVLAIGLTLCIGIPSGRAQPSDTPANITPFALDPAALLERSNSAGTPDGADVHVLDVQETYRFGADGGYVWSRYTLYKVISQNGARDWNELSVDWSPWKDQRPTLRARVIGPTGKEFSLDPATMADSPAGQSDSSVYSDQRTLRAPLPAVSPGVVIETFVEVKTAPTLAGAGEVNRRSLQMSQPIHHIRLTLLAPKTLPLRYQLELLPSLRPQISEVGDQNRWIFESGPMPAHEDEEPGLPSDVPSYPSVVFSTGASWRALAEAYSHTVDERIAATNVRSLAEQITADSSAREEKIASIVAYLNREIRYTGIEFDRASIIPHTPSETLDHRYGDCKDKAALLVALLRSLDIPAYVALLAIGDRLDVPQDQPGLGLFDHAIVYVPGSPEHWIDATDVHARLGELPQRDRGRLALITDPLSTGLSRIPWATPADGADIEERVVTLSDSGPARIVETSKPSGSVESTYRRLYADLTSKNTKDDLSDYFKNQYAAEKLEQFDRTDPKDFSKPFILTLSGSKARRGYTDLRDSVLYIPLDDLFAAIPKDLKTREATEKENSTATHPKKKRDVDYELARPFLTEWHYLIKPPQGFEPGSLPKGADTNLGPIKFTQRFSVADDGVVEATLRAELARQRLTPAEQNAVRDSLSTLLAGDSVKIKFELTAHVLATQGRALESFQAYRDLIKRRPKDAVSHLRRADALLDAGMGEAARAEARQATQLDPHLALAQERLAVILKHDLLGRSERPGADYVAAAAAYRAAIALDATDKSLVANLAILLEYDPRGFRYGSGANLKAAIAEYRRLSAAELEQHGVARNVPFALFYDRQFAEARTVAAALSNAPESLLIACDAVLTGVQSAVQEARRRSADDDKLAENLRVAGSMLMNLRRYTLAADLLEAGAKGPTATRVLNLAAMLRRTVRAEDLHLRDTPEDLARQSIVTALAPDLTVEKARSLNSTNALKANPFPTPKEREALLNVPRAATHAAIAAGISPEALLDIGMQGTQIKSAGDDATGYQVYITAVAQPRQEVLYVREKGRLRILASAAEPSPVGFEVLDRVDRGDLAGARTLLDWVHDGEQHAATDDPYAGTAFSHVWTSDESEADRHSVLLAAASLLVRSEHTAPRGIQILEEIKKDETREKEIEKIDLALLSGYVVTKNHERAAQGAAALNVHQVNSPSVFLTQSRELCMANRCEEAEQLALARLASRKDDLIARRALGSVLVHQGRYEDAYKRFRDVIEDPKAEANDYNNVAWSTLFFTRLEGPDLDSAQHAVQLSEHNFGALHTLACVYAELGRTKEAREVLLQALDVLGADEPDGNSWYTLGRIAEQYGEEDVALADYTKIAPPDDINHIEGSTYRLAQNRLAALKSHASAIGSPGR